MIKQKTCKTYCLIDPRNNKPFYVGVSVDPYKRTKVHISEAKYWHSYRPQDSPMKRARVLLIKEIVNKLKMNVAIKILFEVPLCNSQKAERAAFEMLTNKGNQLLQDGNRVGANDLSALVRRAVNQSKLKRNNKY